MRVVVFTIVRIKLIAMEAGRNLLLLKAQGGGAVRLVQGREELEGMVRLRDVTMRELSRQVEQKRGEMRNMSKEINGILERQYKKQPKERPNFGVGHLSGNVKKLRVEIDGVHRSSEQVKEQIMRVKDQQPDYLVKEIQAHRASLLTLESQIGRLQRSKKMLAEELERNRDYLDRLKQNTCLNDLGEREAQYDKIVKECRCVQKNITRINAQQMQLNNYYYQMKKMSQKEIVEEKNNTQIDQNQIINLAKAINDLTNERKQVEKQSNLKIKNLLQAIAEHQKNIRQKRINIRECQNDILRVNLESKKIPTYSNPYQRKVVTQPKSSQKVANPQVSYKKKQKILNKIYMVQKQEDNAIIVGEWISEGQIFSDRAQPWQTAVIRAKKVIILQSNNQIVGLRVTYCDKNATSIQGRTLIAPDIHSYSQLQVSLDEIVHIEHSARSNSIYMRFADQRGNYKQIGKRAGIQRLQRISLTHYTIKWIEGQIGQTLTGVRFLLQDKPIEQKVIEEQIEENKVKTQRSFSNSTFGAKKVILKGRSLKKLRDEPIVDHRLMLGKNKMV